MMQRGKIILFSVIAVVIISIAFVLAINYYGKEKLTFGLLEDKSYGVNSYVGSLDKDDLKNESLRDDLRNSDSLNEIDGITKEYISNEKRVIITNDSDTILDLKLDSNYVETTLSWNDMDLIAWFTLDDFIGENIVDNVRFYDVNNDYEELNKSYEFKYQNDSNDWIKFSSLKELLNKNIKIGLFTDIVEGDKIEWVIEKDGFNIEEWAIVIGTNSGFLYAGTAPSADPDGAFQTGDVGGVGMVTNDTVPIGATKITEIGWYASSSGAETNFEVALYDDDGGVVPNEAGTRLFLDDTNAYGTGGGWKTVAVDWAVSAGSDYWISVQIDNIATDITTDLDNSGGFGKDSIAAATLPDPFGGGAFDAGQMFAFYALTDAAIPDTTPPNITIQSPQNATTNVLPINFSINSTDDFVVDSCWFSLTGGIFNYTMSNTTHNDIYNATNGSIANGAYRANFYCNDSSNNENNTEFRDFEVDTINPDILIEFPVNNTNLSINTVDINYTASDTTIQNCWFSNDSYSINYSLGDDCVNITNMTWIEGQHNVTVWVNDSAGNVNNTKITFTVDTIFPDILIEFPINLTNTTDTGLDVNYTTFDVGLGFDTCWWTNDLGATNTTLTDCTTNLTTETWLEGINNVSVYVNDSVNNINVSHISFTLDTINPDINITFPINNTNSSDIGLDVNYTASDTNLASCWWTNDLGTTNTTLTDCTTNITGATWLEGINNVTVYVNDTVGNENSSKISFTIDSINPNINITYPINNTFTSDTGIDVNYTVSDDNLDSCWYSNDTYSLNYSLGSNCVNITNITWSEGQHNITIWANDTFGNENESSVTFTISSIGSFVSHIKLNENSGTTAYEILTGNNGTIRGGTYDNDVITLGLTENIDYIISNEIFTIINNNLSWDEINASYLFDSASASNTTTVLRLTGIFIGLVFIVYLTIPLIKRFKDKII